MKGPKHFRNEAFPVVQEFYQRKILTELGYSSGLTSDLAYDKADRFLEVHNEIEKIRAEDSKRRGKK